MAYISMVTTTVQKSCYTRSIHFRGYGHCSKEPLYSWHTFPWLRPLFKRAVILVAYNSVVTTTVQKSRYTRSIHFLGYGQCSKEPLYTWHTFPWLRPLFKRAVILVAYIFVVTAIVQRAFILVAYISVVTAIVQKSRYTRSTHFRGYDHCSKEPLYS